MHFINRNSQFYVDPFDLLLSIAIDDCLNNLTFEECHLRLDFFHFNNLSIEAPLESELSYLTNRFNSFT